MKKIIVSLIVLNALFVGGSSLAMTVENDYTMQPFGIGAEDDYTASEALHKTGYINPQVTQHGLFLQGSLNK